LGGSCYGIFCYILWPFDIFYGQLANFMAIRNILWSFGIFFLVLVCCTKKNLATLIRRCYDPQDYPSRCHMVVTVVPSFCGPCH
jgi:hypothetical protein